jgi:hypothetical protein
MSLRTRVAVVAAAMIAMQGLWLCRDGLGHATIGTVAWNDPVNPTKVIATSRGDNISDEAGTSSLQVFDRVAMTSRPARQWSPARRQWRSRSASRRHRGSIVWLGRPNQHDSEDASGNLSLQLKFRSPPAGACRHHAGGRRARFRCPRPATAAAGRAVRRLRGVIRCHAGVIAGATAVRVGRTG